MVGEDKYCAESLESLVEFKTFKLGIEECERGEQWSSESGEPRVWKFEMKQKFIPDDRCTKW